MPAPAQYTYDAATLVAAHTAVRDQIDAGASGGNCILYSDADQVLATIPLTDPCGTVNPTTGQLTITPASSATASAADTCTYGIIKDSDGNDVVSLPTQAGASAVPGYIVLNTLVIANGAEVTMLSATIG